MRNYDHYCCDWCDYAVVRKTHKIVRRHFVQCIDHLPDLVAHLREAHPEMYWACGEPEGKTA